MDPTTLEAMRRDAAAARAALAAGTLDRAAVERMIRYVERLTEPAPPVPLTLLSDDVSDPLYRIHLEDGDKEAGHTLITICEEELTSLRSTAQVTRVRNAIDFTEPQATWLHAALGQVLEMRAGVRLTGGAERESRQ